MFWFFGHKACGILALQPGFKPIPLTLEGKVLMTGPPGKFPQIILTKNNLCSLSCRRNSEEGNSNTLPALLS